MELMHQLEIINMRHSEALIELKKITKEVLDSEARINVQNKVISGMVGLLTLLASIFAHIYGITQ
jgi:hypothetical protein